VANAGSSFLAATTAAHRHRVIESRKISRLLEPQSQEMAKVQSQEMAKVIEPSDTVGIADGYCGDGCTRHLDCLVNFTKAPGLIEPDLEDESEPG
jgi:hypothetical protein